jgi:hypothetical protein
MISLNYNNIKSGDYVICINNSNIINISIKKKYEILNIYKSKNKYYYQLVDDGDYISSYDAERFETIAEFRENFIDEVLNN